MQNNSESQDAGKYSPLDQQKGEIRVLILQPGGESDELHCTLETYQLESCREFDALSYAWGDPKPVEPIFVDGSRTLIAHNLSVALRHLRYPHSSRVLWIDAVCINQADVDERSHQVFMMNRVYTTANQVLIWLGEARGDSDFAMTSLKELAGGQRATAAETLRLRGLFHDCLMDRDWWGRLWIVQEVVLAKPLREKYQNSQISDGPTLSLYTLLGLTKAFKSTDPRDKIYGCLGLLSMMEREIMKPDYQKPTELVFLEAAKYLLTRTEWGLYSGFSVSTRGKLSMTAPSWLPNFAEQSGLSPTNPVILFPPHSHKVDRGLRHVSFQDRERILAVTGLVLDTIEIAVELKSDPDQLLDQIAELELLVKQAVLQGTSIERRSQLLYESHKGQRCLSGVPCTGIQKTLSFQRAI